MFTADLRTQFRVYLFSENSLVLEAAPQLKASGYRFVSVPFSEESLEKAIKDKPQLVILDIAESEAGIHLFFEKIRSSCPDALVIAIVESVDEGLRLKGQVYDFLLRPFVRSETLLMLIDRACEKIYYEYRLHSLNKKLVTQGNHEKRSEKTEVFQQDFPLAVNSKAVELLALLEEARDLKEAQGVFLDYLYERIERQPILYFKHVLSHHSLGVSMAAGLPLEKVRGVGVNLASMTTAQRGEMLRAPQTSETLAQLMSKAFSCGRYVVTPFVLNQQVDGWVVKFGAFASEENEAFFRSMCKMAEKMIENKYLQFKLHSLQIHDSQTGLHNRESLTRRLEDEIARSRRTYLPVSIIIISIDHHEEYEETAGSEMSMKLKKAIADLLKQTSRITDIAADLGGGDFALLMPHTNQRGAAIKAEKLRRVVESSQFPGGGKVTLSMGVSEYPGFCGDSESLFKSADDALYYVKQLKGNRVCLAKKPESFAPDFEARDISSGYQRR